MAHFNVRQNIRQNTKEILTISIFNAQCNAQRVVCVGNGHGVVCWNGHTCGTPNHFGWIACTALHGIVIHGQR